MKSQFKLYEIDEMLRDAIDACPINEETGEISADWAEFLDACQMERDKKAIQCALVAREFKAEAEAVDIEAKRLTARKRALEAKYDKLREYITYNMQSGEKLKDNRISILCKIIQSYDIIDESALPEYCIRVRREVNRSAISEEIKKGVEVPGIELITKKSITIR